MAFDRIATRRGKATANRAPAQTSGSVVGSDPGKANNIIKSVSKGPVKSRAPKKSGKLKDNDTKGKKSFFNPNASQ